MYVLTITNATMIQKLQVISVIDKCSYTSLKSLAIYQCVVLVSIVIRIE